MAFGGSGAYYNPTTLPSSEAALQSGYTRHVWARSSVLPSTANVQIVSCLRGGFSGSGGYDHDSLAWNHTGAGFYRGNIRRNGNVYKAAQMTPGNFAVDTWLSFAATFDGATLRSYIGGVADGSVAAGASIAGNYQFTLNGDSDYDATPSALFTSGQACELAIWDTALSADDIASLAKGFRASLIRPERLVFYAPAIRGRQDLIGGRTLSLGAGSETITDHPRIIG